MAIKTYVGKEDGGTQSVSLPVLVVDDSWAFLDSSDAITAASAAAYADYEGIPQDDATFRRLCDWAIEVTILYGVTQWRTLIAQRRSDINVQAEPLELTWAPPVARYPGTALNQNGTIFDGERQGAMVLPGNVTDSVKIELPNSLLTPAYRAYIRAAFRRGVINNATVGGHPAGTLQAVQLQISQISNSKSACTFNYSQKENASGEVRGGVSGIAYLGHEFVYNFTGPVLDRNANMVGREIKAVYVTRPRVPFNFSTLSPDITFNVLPDPII